MAFAAEGRGAGGTDPPTGRRTAVDAVGPTLSLLLPPLPLNTEVRFTGAGFTATISVFTPSSSDSTAAAASSSANA